MAHPEEDAPWDPKDEIDPDRLGKEMVELGREMLQNLKRENDEKRRREIEEAARDALPPPTPVMAVGYAAYRPPSFEEVSARARKAWEETKAIAPDAGEFMRGEIFRLLYQAAGLREPGPFDGEPFATLPEPPAEGLPEPPPAGPEGPHPA